MELKGKLMRSFALLFIFSLCFASTIFGALPDENGNKRMMERSPKVLILGAGMAGITAAKTLWEAEIRDFLVLEANGRVGGRVLKDTIMDRYGRTSESVIELGANWVHGTKDNPIWKLVQEAGLNYYNTMNALTEGRYVVLNENGKDVTAEDGHERFAKAEECVEIEEEKQTVDKSKRELLKICGWNPEKPAEKAIEYYAYDFDAAVPPERISCGIKLRSGGEIKSEGDNQALVNDKRGYAKIIEDMAEPFWGKIRHYKVTNIIKKKGDTEITVRVKGGQEFTAEHVLVTFSIGVLQKNMDTMFSPPLSGLPFGEALKKMEMANYLKIFMKFKRKFWQEKDYMFYAPENDEERRLFPVWQNLPGKSYENKQDVPDNDNVLLVTVTGDDAWKLKEAQKVAIENKLFGIFKKVFKTNAKVWHMATHFKNWGKDELFLGAYSNPGVGMTSSDFEKLTSPVKKFLNRLYFAGEGTSELYYGFLHGAYLTGKKQAENIITVMKFQEAQNILAGNMETGWRYVLRRNLGTTRNGTIH